MRIVLYAILCLGILSGCVTNELSPGFSFTSNDKQGILAPAVWSGFGFNNATIQRVDPQAGTFIGKQIVLESPKNPVWPEGSKPDDAAYFLEMTKLSPGFYALISREYGKHGSSKESAGNSGIFNKGTFGRKISECYAGGAPVFEVKTGTIHPVRFEEVSLRPSILRKYRGRIGEIFEHYPAITAPAIITQPSFIIKFEARKSKSGTKCPSSNRISIQAKA